MVSLTFLGPRRIAQRLIPWDGGEGFGGADADERFGKLFLNLWRESRISWVSGGVVRTAHLNEQFPTDPSRNTDAPPQLIWVANWKAPPPPSQR